VDQNAMYAVVVAALAVVVIVGIVVFRRARSFKAHVKGPAGIEAAVEATNPTPERPGGAVIQDAKSRRGQVRADDYTGAGARIRGAEAAGDIRATSRRAAPSEDNAKKV